MSTEAAGIHRVSTEHLTRVLRALHRGALPSPVTRSALIEKAFGDFEGDLDVLVGLDKRGAQAVISAVLKQRGADRAVNLALSYMGPPSPGTTSRDVVDQARDLIASAEKSLFVFGLTPRADNPLLSPLSAVVQGRKLALTICFAARVPPPMRGELVGRLLPAGVELFELRAHTSRGRAILVDEKRLFLSSAPLEATEDDATIDLGITVEDLDIVRGFRDEWARLTELGAAERL